MFYDRFFSFFNEYGTHYVYDAILGGNMILEYEKQFDSTKSKASMKASASAHFSSFFASGSVSASQEEETSSSVSTEKSKTRFKAFGGEPSAAKMITAHADPQKMTDGFHTWLRSIKTHPSIVRFGLRPIYTVLPTSIEKLNYLRTLMKLAMDMYLEGVPPHNNGKRT